jgi:hypothetical protein
MRNYLLIVQGINMNTVPILTERFAHENEDYAKGMHRGLKLAYPKNEVYLEEIKN